MHDKKTGAELVGSFTVEIGDQDEAGNYSKNWDSVEQIRRVFEDN